MFVLLFSLVKQLDSLHHDGTLKALALYLAGELMGLVNISAVDIVIGVAAAAAEELGPALAALGL